MQFFIFLIFLATRDQMLFYKETTMDNKPEKLKNDAKTALIICLPNDCFLSQTLPMNENENKNENEKQNQYKI